MDPPLVIDIKDLEEVNKEVTEPKLKKIVIPKVEQHEVQLLGPEPVFTAAVGTSRLWDARAAGREVAENTLKKLNGKKPDFILLFTTIHYEKHGGFQELLNGAWEVLPEGTPLIGGTVAGFINPEGCYTRGATALAVNYPNMDVAIGIGHNTKRAPKLAAKECAETIKKKLNKSKYKNKFLFDVTSGGKIPNFPGLGRKRVVRSSLIRFLATRLSQFSLIFLQLGVGREEEVLDSLVSELPEYTLIGLSSIDDNKMVENYQFFDRKVVSNVVLALGASSDLLPNVNTTYGLNFTDKKIKISKSSNDKRVVSNINDKSAVSGFLEAIRWPDDFINERMYRKTFFTPLGYKKNGILFPNVLGLCLGNDIMFGYRIDKTELNVLNASGEGLLSAIDENLSEFKRESSFVFGVSCAARLEALGSKISIEGEKTKEYFNLLPFLIVFAGGEDAYSLLKGKRHVNESFNIFALS